MARESYEEHHKRLNRERQRRFRAREQRDGPLPVLEEPMHGEVRPGRVVTVAKHEASCPCRVCEDARR